MKLQNPGWGCPRIAQQIALAFGIPIDKHGSKDSRLSLSTGRAFRGPFWLTFLGHMKDSLWSIDLFRCESATLRTIVAADTLRGTQKRLTGLEDPGDVKGGCGLQTPGNRIRTF